MADRSCRRRDAAGPVQDGPRGRARRCYRRGGSATRRWAWLRSRAGSVTMTWPPSWTTWLSGPAGELVTADEAHSAQPGTSGWAALGSTARVTS